MFPEGARHAMPWAGGSPCLGHAGLLGLSMTAKLLDKARHAHGSIRPPDAGPCLATAVLGDMMAVYPAMRAVVVVVVVLILVWPSGQVSHPSLSP